MNLTALQTELKARGFDYLDTTRLNYFLNAGYTAFCESQPWPFLEATTTGTSPVTVGDLRSVLYVVDTTNTVRLMSGDSRDVIDDDPTGADTGNPWMYWLDNLTIRVYPTNTVALSIRYLKVPSALSSGSDTPIIPTRYHDMIVDIAQVEALKDRGGWAEAQALRDDIVKRLAIPQTALEDNKWDDPDFIVVRPGMSTDW